MKSTMFKLCYLLSEIIYLLLKYIYLLNKHILIALKDFLTLNTLIEIEKGYQMSLERKKITNE